MRAHDLEEMFNEYGEIAFAKVVIDKATGRSKWFGFVEYKNLDDAVKAQKELNGGEISGREIKVEFASPSTSMVPEGADMPKASAIDQPNPMATSKLQSNSTSSDLKTTTATLV